jgi:ribosome biogenesis protein Tsr3
VLQELLPYNRRSLGRVVAANPVGLGEEAREKSDEAEQGIGV